MAIYTIGGEAIGDKVRYRLSEYGQTEDFTDSELNNWIADAVREYSKYRPRFATFTINTVADQATYDLPVTDLISILHHNYGPTEMTEFTDIELEYPLTFSSDPFYPAQHSIDNLRIIQSDAPYRGVIERVGKKLIFYPTPKTVRTITVEYYAYHVLATTDYSTVDPNDIPELADLVAAKCFTSLAGDYSKRPDVTEGQTQYRFEAAQKALRRHAFYLEQRALGNLSVGALVSRS